MPSRIDIGPEGGPFVAINENSNDLELQDINGNVIAKWDETAGQWDLNNNSLTGINSIDASSANVESLSTEVATIGDVNQFTEVDTIDVESGDTGTLTADIGTTDTGTQILVDFTRGPRTDDSVEIRLETDGGEDGEYWYQIHGESKQSGANYIQIATLGTFQGTCGNLLFSFAFDTQMSLDSRLNDARDRSDMVQRGGVDASNPISELQFVLPDSEDEWTSWEAQILKREVGV